MLLASEYNLRAAVLSWFNEKPRHGLTHENVTDQERYRSDFLKQKLITNDPTTDFL